MTPHKHARVIKAWADGAVIQTRRDGSPWTDISNPGWFSGAEYRVKPEVIEYRLFVWRSSSGRNSVLTVTRQEDKHEPREHWVGFVRWVHDWQQVVV